MYDCENVSEIEGLFGFFVGQTLKKMGGKANPAVVNKIIKEKLG